MSSPSIIDAESLRKGPTAPRLFEGAEYSGVPLSFFLVDGRPGEGPGLDVHPYDEIFIVHEGAARFGVGNSTVEAVAGQIVLRPRQQPHLFVDALHPTERVVTGRPQRNQT